MSSKEYGIRLNEKEDDQLLQYMKENHIKYKAEACRSLIALSKINDLNQEQLDMISLVVKNELEEQMKVHNKRIKSILYNAGCMASTTTYICVGILRDFIKGSKKKNVSQLYEDSSKFAVKEVKKKVEE